MDYKQATYSCWLLQSLDKEKPNPYTDQSLSSVFIDLSLIANRVIAEGSGIGFNTVYDDDDIEASPLPGWFRSKVADANSALLVAFGTTGAPVGALTLAHSLNSDRGAAKRHRVDIQCFFTDPRLRHQGVGSLLLSMADHYARRLSSHVTILTLDARSTQKSAISLYKQAGYKLWGTFDDYAIGETLVVMYELQLML